MIIEEANPEIKFQEFFSSFKTESGEYKYRKKLAQMALNESKSLIVDFEDLVSFDSSLAREVVQKPDEFLVYASKSAWAQLKIEDPEYAEQLKIVFVRFRKTLDKTSIRTIGSDLIGTLVTVDGIVVRATPVKPLLMKAAFRCRKCDALTYVEQTGFLMKTPPLCPQCKGKAFDFIEKESTFINHQELRIQEKPEDLPPGQLPRVMDVEVTNDLVDVARPGDRITLTGIVRAKQEMSSRSGKLRTFELYLDANFIDTQGREIEDIEITPEEEEEIKKIASSKDVYEKLIKSIAPSIYGYPEIKEAILYLLFSGVRKHLPDGVTIRGDINVLLVGDPGTAKSALLQYVARIAPRGLYTSGRGSTAAGLCTVYDSLIQLENGELVKIGELVEEELQKHSEKIKEGFYSSGSIERKTIAFDSKTLKLKPLRITGYWKLKAPDKLVKITTKTNREIIVTPENPIPIIKNGKVIWKKAIELTINDYIAAPRYLPVKPTLNSTFPSLTENAWIVNKNIFIENLIENIKSNYTIRQFANNTGISEDDLYYGWKHAGTPTVSEIKTIIDQLNLNEYFLSEKASKLNKAIEIVKLLHSNIDLIPEIGSLLKQIRRKLSISCKKFYGYKKSLYETGRHKPSREYLRKLSSKFNLKELEKFVNSDILWDKIKTIEIIDNTNRKYEYVYDITVEGAHSFMANGLIIHNTAAVIREKSGGMVLEAGALVLADKGVACIDEIDKMKPEDRVAIHEAMEQQTVSVAKGGIVATLNARASVLAAANPALGRYDPYRLITENINLPVTILSRFDLIFVMKDEPNQEIDEKMSTHILSLHQKKEPPESAPIPPELLRKYISYAKKIEPKLTDGAVEELKSFYLKMRGSSGSAQDSPIAITPRQLEALVRLAEARARAALRSEVTAEDAKAIIKLMNASLQNVGIDVTTGKIDIDVIMTGKPKSLRDTMQIVRAAIAELQDEDGVVEEQKLYKTLIEKFELKEDDVKKAVNQLLKEGLLYAPKPGFLKRTIP
ncbi:MAG: ATP-binding protein [Candidatus Bathyarchaeia archaeon]